MQNHVPDLLVDRSLFHTILSRVPGVIGSYFNYSEVLFECKKN